MANFNSSTLYVGITSNLIQRVYQHKNKLIAGFTSKYNVNKLVYFERSEKELVHFETFEDIEQAILREKQIKGGSRSKKIDLIKSRNSLFEDVYEDTSR